MVTIDSACGAGTGRGVAGALLGAWALLACGGSARVIPTGSGGESHATGIPSEFLSSAQGGGGGENTPSAASSPGIASAGPAISRRDGGGGGGGGNGSAGVASAGGPGVSLAAQYSGHGFVVHEWGTDTIVVGSDGSLQRGLHHEEEDLPPFVYDRIKQGSALATANPSTPSVTIKMETPVTYFYSDQPLTVHAQVAFPQGILTQWYPGVTQFMPPIAAVGSVMPGTSPLPASYADPVLDVLFPYQNLLCREAHSALTGGRLDWGQFSVLAPSGAALSPLPPAPLEQFGWSYARAVASNPLRMPSGESEQFLFYRGLGDFELPVSVRAFAMGKVTLTNSYPEPIGQVFVLNVDGQRGAFTEHAGGIATGSSLSDTAPSLEGAPTLESYADALGAAVTTALDGAGLFHDEATAMVNTWKRQWFRTPGTRLLYLIPQSWTDHSIPLTIEPQPDETRRVMLIRVEVITPEQETADVAALALFDLAPDQAAAHFGVLGRFAEPRLRRALSLAPNTAGTAYLAKIQTANSSVGVGE